VIRAVVIPGLVLALAAGCSSREDRVAFDGQYFRSSISNVNGDQQQFAISVQPVSVSLQGALEAGRYEATRYCVENYGNSGVEWVVGPGQNPDTYRIENDTLVLRGACQWR
jgi:hypothetical protein